MQLTGAFGVIGSAAVLLVKAFIEDINHLAFFRLLSYLVTIFGGICMISALVFLVYFKPRQIRLSDVGGRIKGDEVDVKDFDMKV
jgi:hypothetical protein